MAINFGIKLLECGVIDAYFPLPGDLDTKLGHFMYARFKCSFIFT